MTAEQIRNMVKLIHLAGEAARQPLSEPMLQFIAGDLQNLSYDDVMYALERCIRNPPPRITIHEIVSRFPSQYPGVEEAWSIASQVYMDEWKTVVWTEQMRDAHAVANAIKHDKIAAHMAFKEVYPRLVVEAKEQGKKPKWIVSLGDDVHGRAPVIEEAIAKGLIVAADVERMIPKLDTIHPSIAAVLPQLKSMPEDYDTEVKRLKQAELDRIKKHGRANDIQPGDPQ